MADYFSQQPNFINPSYATPEQLASQRAYADALTKRSGENITRPTGAAANIIDAITAALTRNNANQIQQQAAAGNANNFKDMISQLQRGAKVDPENLATVIANPMAAPEQRALAIKLMSPEPVKSEFGQPAYQSPAQGVQAAPIQGNFTPGYRVNQGAEGVHSDAPVPAPGAGGMFGGMSKPVGWDQGQVTPQALGAPQAGAALPAAPPAAVAPNGAPSAFPGLDALAAKGRELAFQRGNNESQTNVAKQDIDAAATAPAIKRIAGIMLDDIHSHGDQMTFGPSAESSNNIKKFVANYAPNLLGDKQIQGLASADSFEKMSAQLTSMLAKGGGTDAQLFNNMKSVPGAHNSKEGAEALLKMVTQVADQQQALRQVVGQAKSGAEYEASRNDFYKKNPIVNPLTGNPIQQDIEAQQRATRSAPQSGPPPGTIHNGYRFKGGNPNDKANWEPST